MLEMFDQNPQSRVFHVDRECYIVYLGSHWEDYKPFLRLGTSTHLPAELPPIISTIVVPDVLTGNPLDEPQCLTGDATADTHYVGDVETVEHMKQFVGQESIPVEAIEAIDHEEDDGKHVLVYYYRDGNLKIKFRKNEVFDLRRREKLDAHFVARAQEAKNEYGRSPFKMPGDVYQPHGFVLVGGAPYLVARGEFAAFRLTGDYFFELSAAGLDADRIATVQAEEADAALIRFFKRSRTRNRAVRVSTPRRDRVEAAVAVFPENSLPSLKAKVYDGHGGAFEFHRFSVTQAPGRFEAHLDELGGAVQFGSAAKKRPDAAVNVDPTAGTMTIAAGKTTYPVLEGVVYQFADARLSRSDIEERFLPDKSYPYRELLSQSENALLGQLQYFFNELFAGRDTGKVLRTIRGLDVVKAFGRSGGVHPIVQVQLHNYAQYLSYLRAHEPEVAKGVEPLASLLSRNQLSRADVVPMLPLVAELHRDGDQTYLLYRFAARITSDRYAHAERVVEKIRALPAIDFESERQRLADLISGLATPEQMDEARMRRIAAAKQQQRKAKTTSGAAAADEASSGDSDETAGEAGEPGRAASPRDARRRRGSGGTAGGSTRGASGGASGRGGRGQRGGGSRRSRWVLPTAALVLLLVALFLLLYTGTIPNRWFADETTIVGVDGATQRDGSTDGGTDGSTDGTDDAAGGETGEDGPATDGDGTDSGDSGVAGEDGAADAGTGGGTAAQEDATTDETTPDATTPDDADSPASLPEGWPADALPAIRALENTPGVTITPDRVIGPGGIEITLRDIIELVNRIATENGYATMGAIDSDRPDPDWIYPGNVFVLPNGTRYTVVDGDTLWEITVRYLVARLRQDFERYSRLVAEYESPGTSDARSDEIVRTLAEIGEESHTENFSRMVEEVLDQWGE